MHQAGRKDTGIGIEKGQIEQVFDRFYQADSSLTRPRAARASLSLVKELVDMQGADPGCQRARQRHYFRVVPAGVATEQYSWRKNYGSRYLPVPALLEENPPQRENDCGLPGETGIAHYRGQ
ncbi:MAG: hypothetical protein H6559_16755 [Lewinellaceae bacterium]|nr:hypothetical protein [Lewinellaceae bacterium]